MAEKQDKSQKPIRIHEGGLLAYRPFNPKQKVEINNFIWANTPIAPGKTFLTSQGARLVLDASSKRVVYLLTRQDNQITNKPFVQVTNGFIADVTMYPFEDAGKKLQPVRKLAEFEVQILLGALSTTSWTNFFIVLGGDVTQMFISNTGNIRNWPKIFKACLKANKELKTHAPTLREKLIYSALLVVLEGTDFIIDHPGAVTGAISDAAMSDPNIAGRGMGIIAGKLSTQALNGRISALSAVWTILFTVATKALAAIPGALEQSGETYASDKEVFANQILRAIKRSGIQLTTKDANKIVEEVSAHPKELIGIIINLKEAFNKQS